MILKTCLFIIVLSVFTCSTSVDVGSKVGTFICFQIGKANQEAGVGYCFFIMDLEEASKHLDDFKSFNE